MSSDNGIYILKTKHPKDESKFEFRVIHAQAIENIYWDAKLGKETFSEVVPEEAASYFGQAEVFTNASAADMHASNLADECTYLEYGIRTLDHSDWVFEHFTDDELEKYFREADRLGEKRRQERQAKLDAARKRATLRLDPGVTFTPRSITGYITTPEGDEINGSLTSIGVEKIVIGEGGAEFLPFDWIDSVDQ